MPMWEITVESKTRVTENGRAVLYETKYCGLQEEDGIKRFMPVWSVPPVTVR